jgi:hypothetical protein
MGDEPHPCKFACESIPCGITKPDISFDGHPEPATPAFDPTIFISKKQAVTSHHVLPVVWPGNNWSIAVLC